MNFFAYRRWRIGVTVWMLLLTGGLCFAQQEVPHFVTIQVTDPTGEPIAGAEIRSAEVGGRGMSVLRTDGKGLAYLAIEQSTAYEVSVFCPGFMTSRQTITSDAALGKKLLVRLEIGFSSMPIHVREVSPIESEDGASISPARVVPVGGAPGMKSSVVSKGHGDTVYVLVFAKGDEVLSGLTDFAIAHHVVDASFTGIGAVSSATMGWLDVEAKTYRGTVTREQVEVLSMVGDVATFQGKPVVHAHVVLGRRDGSTVGGHLWEARVNPTLEVFLTAHRRVLEKKLDAGSGMKLIEP